MAAVPAGGSEWGGTTEGDTLGETETETPREKGQWGGSLSQEEGREELGAEVSAV